MKQKKTYRVMHRIYESTHEFTNGHEYIEVEEFQTYEQAKLYLNSMSNANIKVRSSFKKSFTLIDNDDRKAYLIYDEKYTKFLTLEEFFIKEHIKWE